MALARALHGLAAVAVTRTSAGLASRASDPNSETAILGCMSPAFILSVSMTAGPTVAGLVLDYTGGLSAVFHCAYAVIALNIVLAIFAIRSTSQQNDYSAVDSDETQTEEQALERTPASHSRLVVAMYGYLVVGLLSSALQSVLPLFAELQYDFLQFGAVAFVFVPLFAPAALVSPVAGLIAKRAPKSTRFLATLGFLACAPAFLLLGRLAEAHKPDQSTLISILGAIALGMGFSAESLVSEISQAVMGTSRRTSDITHPMSATVDAAGLPNLAHAWGSLIGPLCAVGVMRGWGWETMARTLSVISACSGLMCLLFLQGWVGRISERGQGRTRAVGSDEESAPLLSNGVHAVGSYGSQGNSASFSEQLKKASSYKRTTSIAGTSESDGSDSRTGRKSRGHRRKFSVDNFSFATTTVQGGTSFKSENSMSQVRFQASLETPVPLSSSSAAANTERRFLMREAPHAPATDPLLAAGSRYVIDEERSKGPNGEEKGKRHVVVFEEGSAPPELLRRRPHHIVAINGLDGSAKLVSTSNGGQSDNHAVHVVEEEDEAEEEEEGKAGSSKDNSRRYIVVLLEEGETGLETEGDEQQKE